MEFFCPFINGDCRNDCVFYTKSKSTESNCRLDEAAINLKYIADFVAEKVDKEETEESSGVIVECIGNGTPKSNSVIVEKVTKGDLKKQ